MAVRKVPEILQTVANKFEDLRELLVDAKEELIGETFSIPSIAEEIESSGKVLHSTPPRICHMHTMHLLA